MKGNEITNASLEEKYMKYTIFLKNKIISDPVI